MSNPKSLSVLTEKLKPRGQRRLFEFLDVVDTDTAARFRAWLSSATDSEMGVVADLLNRASHGREFAGWWRTRDKAPAVQTAASPGHSQTRTPLGNPHSQSRTRSANRDLTVGGAWLLGGLLVTIITYNIAANNPNGGHYYIASGAILYGAFRLFRGITAG